MKPISLPPKLKRISVLPIFFALLINQSLAQIAPPKSLPCLSQGNIEKVKELLAAGVRVDSTYDSCIVFEPSPGETTLLMTAAGTGNLELINLLLEHGADIKAKNTWGETPLTIAIKYQKIAIIPRLFEKGAEINSRGENNITPLMQAAATGNPEIIDYLLNKGADILARDVNNVTALMYAAAYQKPEAMALLVRRGAKPNARDKKGRKAKTYLKKGFPREYLIFVL